jgi:hypothetical protein
MRGIAPPEEFSAGSCTPNPAPLPPHARGRSGTTRPGVVGDPAAGCISSVPPVGGWGRLGAGSWPQIRRWDRRRCCRRISGPPGGLEIRWVLSVGWCPSKRVVVIHCARTYTAQKVSGGCVTAISGSASKFAEDTCYEMSVVLLCKLLTSVIYTKVDSEAKTCRGIENIYGLEQCINGHYNWNTLP